MKRNASHHKSLTRNSLLVMMCLLLSGLVFACDPDTTSPGVEIDTNTACCADCICRGDAPTQSSYRNGPYRYTSYNLPRTSYRAGATVYYPTNAEPPFAGIVYCPPYTGTESMLAAWGPFFASHGIVLVTMSTTTMDTVDSRDDQQRDALDALKAEHTRSGSPLQGKLSNRFGVMGWSMGGGATWINASKVAGLKSAMSLAGHNATAMDRDARGGNIKCPTLIMNGATDMTILGGMGQSSGVYDAIANNIPKILYEVRGVGHMSWMTPTQPGNAAAELALAFQKTFLEGDTRWGKFIVQEPRNASDWETNIRVR